jgi:hypothetical protein
MAEIGGRVWVIPDGYIPGGGASGDPALEPHESFSILNAGHRDVAVEVMLYFADREPAGPYRARVPAERCLHLRPTGFDAPEPVPRDTDYAAVIRADGPVVVQQTRLDSRRGALALLSALAYPVG